LPYWYGNLGQEKEFIGKKMKEICTQKGMVVDIEWEGTKRIYGDDWHQFLTSAKATLGTESGANIFDFSGDISTNINRYLEKNPNAGYNKIFDKFLAKHEGLVKMNQISPKIFEAICLKTALILFEGEYSGILVPDVHFIPLKKDFTNIDVVLEKLNDDEYLTYMVDNAFTDIVKSKKYSYTSFVSYFDQCITLFQRQGQNIEIDFTKKSPPIKEEFSLQMNCDKPTDLVTTEDNHLLSTEDNHLLSTEDNHLLSTEDNHLLSTEDNHLSSSAFLKISYLNFRSFIIVRVRIFNPLLRQIKKRLPVWG
jgi:hypothetical protein